MLCYPIPKSYAKKLRAFCDKYDIEVEFDWDEYIMAVGQYFSTMYY